VKLRVTFCETKLKQQSFEAGGKFYRYWEKITDSLQTLASLYLGLDKKLQAIIYSHICGYYFCAKFSPHKN
jgi:Gpi18-like mannosyltransferase